MLINKVLIDLFFNITYFAEIVSSTSITKLDAAPGVKLGLAIVFIVKCNNIFFQ